MLNENEKNALRYYIGDVSGSDAFYGDPKAYVVINSLFFPEITTERARAAEGKYLNPAIIEDTGRLLEFFSGLFSAFRKCAAGETINTFRVERFSDYSLCKEYGHTLSLTSTSKAGFLGEYRDRLGIALMKFEISAGTPCIDVGAALDVYVKPEEAEVLLPPFTRLEITEYVPSGEEAEILDSAGKPPIVGSKVKTCGIASFSSEICEFPADGNKAGMRVYTALNAGKEPDDEDVKLYTCWKSALVKSLNGMI